jgi:hypothetical protein
VLCIRGGPLVVCTAAALQRHELALAKLQKRSVLLVAALGSAFSDLPLSLRPAAPTHGLLDCREVHALCPDVAALHAARLSLPPNVPLALLQRIVLQTFSVAGTDVIGHSLAVSSRSSLGRARPARVQVHRTAPAAAT